MAGVSVKRSIVLGQIRNRRSGAYSRKYGIYLFIYLFIYLYLINIYPGASNLAELI